MSGRDPIDFDSPLGISKREWTKVLGVNLALLLLAYCVALVFTLCGNGAFFLNFNNDQINAIEKVIRYGQFNFYPLIQMATATLEAYIIGCYICKKILKWYFPLGYFATFVGFNFLFNAIAPLFLNYLTFSMNALFFICLPVFELRVNDVKGKPFLFMWIRLAIGVVVSLGLNEAISIFRIKTSELFVTEIGASAFFALNVEYYLALALALGFLTLLIPWEKGGQQWEKFQAAGGSSPTLKRWSRKNSLTKNNLSPKLRRRLTLLKAKVIVIQTVALAVIAALPWFAGRPVEFTLLYLAFCLTRVILGFNHSLHFKSELACVTIGALTFWGLTFLAPSAEASIILSLAYGAGLALGFRLWWELHDLMMYRKAAKTDRYAMFYTAFKGNIDPRHIRGVMRLRGFSDESYIKAVQMYMAKEKVDYIAEWLNEPLRSVDRKLTEIADELYRLR